VSDNHLSKKSLLVIGATSSLAQELLSQLELDTEGTVLVGRSIPRDYPKPELWLELDLSIDNSVMQFLQEINKYTFEKILFFIGATTNRHYIEISLEELAKYNDTYVTNSNYLVCQLTKQLGEQGAMILVSSRAALHPSYDVHYAVSKAAQVALVKSISRFLPPGQAIVALAPSLIAESKMYSEMSDENRAKHRMRTGGELISISEFANYLSSLDIDSLRLQNGRTIELGSDI
jgi:NAD(P)-dependent dehydrogenase (short-subunit alcohol dehydrogenase family)